MTLHEWLHELPPSLANRRRGNGFPLFLGLDLRKRKGISGRDVGKYCIGKLHGLSGPAPTRAIWDCDAPHRVPIAPGARS